MTRIMVVDDESDLEVLIRQKFRQKIRDKEFDFRFASDGLKALSLLENKELSDIVLCDINMPEMDGLTLLQKLNEDYPLIKTVIVSAYGDLDNIRTAMNRGAFDFITKPINFDDLEATLEKTIRFVHQIQDTVRAIRENNILKMYVDQNVLKFMTGHEFEQSVLVSESIEATVAFIDLSNFTSFSEREKPELVIQLLNKYFDLIAREIIEQEGYIDKFIGDCVMAVFKGNFHLDRCIESCLAIRKLFKELPNEFGFEPNISIGINSGEMISGNCGSASLKRLDYTVIGDVVNTAQRIQSIAHSGQILMTENSYEKVKQSFQFKCLGTVQLKHKMNEMVLYEVLN